MKDAKYLLKTENRRKNFESYLISALCFHNKTVNRYAKIMSKGRISLKIDRRRIIAS